MESNLEEDSVPFVVRGPDNVIGANVPFVVRGPDKNGTVPFVARSPDNVIGVNVPFVARGPDKNDQISLVARGPDISDFGFLGIPENNPRSGEHWKESISLCSSGVSSMNSSLTSSGYRDYEEHSDDDDSRLYGSGTESRLSSSVQIHYPPSLSKDITTKVLDVPLKKADGANQEYRKISSTYHSINTDVTEAKFPDNSDVLSSFSQLSIKSDSKPYLNGAKLTTEKPIGVAEKDITGYNSCEAGIEKFDLMKPVDTEGCQEALDKINSFIDQNKISVRGKNTKNNSHIPNSQNRRPYDRHPSVPPSLEVQSFGRNRYGNVPEAVQQHEIENTIANPNTTSAEELIFADDRDMEDFITRYSPERTDTHEPVVRGPPLVLPDFRQTFGTRGNVYNSVESVQPTIHYGINHPTTRNIPTQYMNNLNFANNQFQSPNSAINPPPQIPPVHVSTQGCTVTEEVTTLYNLHNYDPSFNSLTNIHNVINNDINNTCSNQDFVGPSGIHGHVRMMQYDNQGSGFSTRRINMYHNSPTTSNVPSSPTSSEKSVPSPSSQTSLKSPAMLQVQSPCPSTPDGNIPNIISNYNHLSVYSSNSSISSGQSSSSGKASSSESPRSCNDQDGTVDLQGSLGTGCTPLSDIPRPIHFGTIPEVDDIANTTVKTIEKSNIPKYSENDEDDDEEDEDADGNTRVHNLAFLEEEEFEVECKKFVEHDNGSEFRRSMNVENGDKRTPLYIAVIRNNIRAVECFLDQGADPTKNCHRRVCYGTGNYVQYYENVLHLACEKGFEDIVDLLLDHPSKKDLINDRRQGDDKTPLLICLNVHDMNRDRLGIVRKLLRKGANLNLKETHSGKSPFMLAIEKHEIDFVKEELSRLNPDYRRELLEQTDYDGNTCLHYSAQIASRDSRGRPRDSHMVTTHTNLRPLTDEQVQIFNSSLNLDGANIDAQNLDKVKPKDLRRELTALPRGQLRTR